MTVFAVPGRGKQAHSGETEPSLWCNVCGAVFLEDHQYLEHCAALHWSCATCQVARQGRCHGARRPQFPVSWYQEASQPTDWCNGTGRPHKPTDLRSIRKYWAYHLHLEASSGITGLTERNEASGYRYPQA